MKRSECRVMIYLSRNIQHELPVDHWLVSRSVVVTVRTIVLRLVNKQGDVFLGPCLLCKFVKQDVKKHVG